MNNDLISREALKRAACVKFYTTPYYKHILDIIDNAPTVDLKDIYQEGYYDGHLDGYTKAINEERPHGKWLEKGKYQVECDQCHYDDCAIKSNYCPNCGAKMDGGEEE